MYVPFYLSVCFSVSLCVCVYFLSLCVSVPEFSSFLTPSSPTPSYLLYPISRLPPLTCSISFPAPSKYNVSLGKNKLFQDEPSAQHQLVSKSFPHPGFNMSLLMIQKIPLGADLSNDLMLLRLSKPADITDVVKPIVLPTKEPKLGSTCLASGWGSTTPFKFQNAKDFQCVNLKLLPNENCDKNHNKKVTDVMVCVGEMDGGKDTCVGDSGGPLICDGVLQGITSWGSIPCSKPNTPGIYTKLTKFNSWIKDTMTKNA
uniref:Peptidase S1 domain-containing protein n=1 Tax=Mus spicilegus TaxID=10103 RepID=A0A8C6I3L8_MUSSI